MKVIAVLNQKGGSGKTTIATHLARALLLDGAAVLLVDSDPQGSARDWAAVKAAITDHARADGRPPCSLGADARNTHARTALCGGLEIPGQERQEGVDHGVGSAGRRRGESAAQSFPGRCRGNAQLA